MLAYLFALPDPRDLTIYAVIQTAAIVVTLCLVPLVGQLLFSRLASRRMRQRINTALALAFSSLGVILLYGSWIEWQHAYMSPYFGIWVVLLLAVASLAAAIDLIHCEGPSRMIGIFALIAPGLFIFYYAGLAVNNAFLIYYWSQP